MRGINRKHSFETIWCCENQEWMLFLPLFCCWGSFVVGVVLLPVATFGSHPCTRFLSLSIRRSPKSRSKKAHERFGKSLTSKSPSQSDIFCKLRCNNLPEESNPVRDTGSIRGKDLWQMATKQTTNGEFKQFVLRMILVRGNL